MLTDQQEMAYFISGLREPLRANVRAQNPTNLSSTIALARIYEGKSQEIKKGPITTAQFVCKEEPSCEHTGL